MKFCAEKYNRYCGIAKVKHPETNKEIFVVYAEFSFDENFEDLEEEFCVGDVIGAGETKDLALSDALKNMVEMHREGLGQQ